MAGVQLWGWDSNAKTWRQVIVDANGKIKISDADPFTIAQATPQNLKHVPHGYYPTGGTYLPYQVDSAGKLLLSIAALQHLSDIADVNLTGLADGDFIYYDSASGTWKRLAHKDVTTGIHGVGASTIASLQDIATHAALAATHGRTNLDGVTERDTAIGVHAALALAANVHGLGEWASYTPTSGNLTVGNGTLTGYYSQAGKIVLARIYFKLGSTSAIGTNPYLGLPVAAKAAVFSGLLFINDYGTGNLVGLATTLLAGGNVDQVTFCAYAASGAYITLPATTATVPITWAVNDEIYISICYEAA